VDAKFSPRLSFRVVQFDWMSFHANGGSSNNNFRYSAGIVIRPQPSELKSSAIE
jgi:hypothetical protein